MRNIFFVLICFVVLSGCDSKKDSLVENQFVAACSIVEGCKMAYPNFSTIMQNEVLRNDQTDRYYFGSLICVHREIAGREDEESACVQLKSKSFATKQEVMDRSTELEFENIAASKQAWLGELPKVIYRR